MHFKNLSRQLEAGPVQCQRGVCALDIDDDGIFEAYICARDGPNVLLDFDDGVYRLFILPQLSDAAASSQSAIAADVNADGLEELYVHNSSDETADIPAVDRLFSRHGLGWVDVFSHEVNRFVRNTFSGYSLSVIDRKGKGVYDIVVQNNLTTGPVRVYEVDDHVDERLRDVAVESGLDILSDGIALLAAPLCGHSVGLLVSGNNDSDRLFLSTQCGRFTETELTQSPIKSGKTMSFCLVDDPRYGLCVFIVRQNYDSRLFRVVQGQLVAVEWKELEMIEAPHNVVAADLNNNGYQDILVTTTAGRNYLFVWQDGQWTSISPDVLAEPGGSCSGVCVADFNGNGRLEVLITHGERGPQPLSLYEHEATENAWIRIMPLTKYQAPARGCLVTLEANGQRQTRVIDSGSSTLCQMEPVAHFGLGCADMVDEVVVTWPDGTTQSLMNLKVNTNYKVVYPKSEKAS